VILIIIIITGTCLMVYTSLQSRSKFSITLKLLINYFQIMALIGDFPLSWPSGLQFVWKVSKSVNFDIASFAYACVWDVSFPTKFIISLCLPVISLIAPIIIYGVVILYWKFKRVQVNLIDYKPKYISAVLVINFLVHPLITKYTFKWFSCADIGTGSYLLADMTISCTSDAYQSWLGGAIAVAVIYCCGLPLLAFFLLFRNRFNLSDKNTMIKYRFLYDGFDDRYYYWELMTVLEKMLLITLVVIFHSNNGARLFTAVNIVFIYILLHVLLRPFTSDLIWKLQLAAQGAIFLVLTGGSNVISAPDQENRVVVDIIVVIVAWIVTGAFLVVLVIYSFKKLRLFAETHWENYQQKQMIKKKSQEFNEDVKEEKEEEKGEVNPKITRKKLEIKKEKAHLN